jgi:hypothetical protein
LMFNCPTHSVASYHVHRLAGQRAKLRLARVLAPVAGAHWSLRALALRGRRGKQGEARDPTERSLSLG